MAPHGVTAEYLWLDKNRYSPRILNKKTKKLDISSVNNKIDFMRCLNLFCTERDSNKENTKKPSKGSVQKCSVVQKNLKCDICGQCAANKGDMENHQDLHRRLSECNNNSVKNILCNYDCDSKKCTNYMQSYKREDLKSLKKSRRRSKDAKTKVTLKIGREVISKVYCKNKYLDLACLENKKSNKTHDSNNCGKCDEIKETLPSQLSDPTTPMDIDQAQDVQPERNIDRVRQMAALLVEQELRRIALQNSEDDSDDESEEELEEPDCSVVPQVINQKPITEVENPTQNESNNQNCSPAKNLSLNTKENFEVITIEDDDEDVNHEFGNLEVNYEPSTEPISPEANLMEPELTYSINISNASPQNMAFSENLKLFCSQSVNKDYQDLSLKLGSNLPLRIINY